MPPSRIKSRKIKSSLNMTMEETMQSNWNTFIKDLVYFTTRTPDKSDTSATRTTGVQHECNRSATGVI